MSYSFFLAKRFLTSRKDSKSGALPGKFVSFVTFISIAGVAIGVAALIIAVAVMSGFEKEITAKAVSVSSHIQIVTFKTEGIKDYQSVINTVTDTSHKLTIISAHPYAQKESVIKFKDKTEGIVLKGVRNEDNVFSQQRKIVSGSGELMRIDSSVSTIVIGSKLASKLGLGLGDKIFIIATVGLPSVSNTPNIKQFRVTGIYESGLKEYDDVLLYAMLKDAQKLFDMGSNVTGIEVMISDTDKIKENTTKIKKILGYPYNARSIYQIYKGLFTWVELQKEPIPVILGLIVIVASINVIGFLLMIVLEKTRSIGILKSLGATDFDIIKIFFYQGILISVAGILLGNVLGYGICYLQIKFDIIKIPELYYMSRVPLQIDSNVGFIVTAIALTLSIIVTIIPSYLASRLSPIASIRFK